MGPETRVQAKAKLDAFSLKIGHPDTYKSYPGLDVTETSAFANAEEQRGAESRHGNAPQGEIDRGFRGRHAQGQGLDSRPATADGCPLSLFT